MYYVPNVARLPEGVSLTGLICPVSYVPNVSQIAPKGQSGNCLFVLRHRTNVARLPLRFSLTVYLSCDKCAQCCQIAEGVSLTVYLSCVLCAQCCQIAPSGFSNCLFVLCLMWPMLARLPLRVSLTAHNYLSMCHSAQITS